MSTPQATESFAVCGLGALTRLRADNVDGLATQANLNTEKGFVDGTVQAMNAIGMTPKSPSIMRFRRPNRSSAMLFLVMIVVPLGAARAAITVPLGAPTVTITATTGHISLSTDRSPSGTVTFKLVNPDKVMHEIDIVRTTLDRANLPIKASGQFDEHTPKARVVKEAVKAQPGTTRTFTARLTPGTYVIVDNLPGHYHSGESAAFTTT